MKKLMKLAFIPLVWFTGLLLVFWIGSCLLQYENLDKLSAIYGGLFVIAVDVLYYFCNCFTDLIASKSKKNNDTECEVINEKNY